MHLVSLAVVHNSAIYTVGPRWDAVSCAAQHLSECFGDIPSGQILIISDSGSAPAADLDLSKCRLPFGIRLHQVIVGAEGFVETTASTAMNEMILRHHGSISKVAYQSVV